MRIVLMFLLHTVQLQRGISIDEGVRNNLLGVFSSYDDPIQHGDQDNATCNASENFVTEITNKETVARLEKGKAGSEFFGTFRKLGISWIHIVKSYVRIIGLAGGKARPEDVLVDTMEEGLEALTKMTRDMDFSAMPYRLHGHSLNDLFFVFLKWSVTNGAVPDTSQCTRKGGLNGQHEKINVSIALRRLQIYKDWIEEVLPEDGQPITDDSVQTAREIFAMRLEYDDCNRLVWNFDLSRTDIEGVKSLPARETNRFFVWFAHWMLFDKQAQDNGIVFVNNLNHVSFFSLMTMLELKVGIKLDEFMICVVPLNTKLVLFLNPPQWADFGFGILSVFLTKEMKNRVWLAHGDKQNQKQILQDALGETRVLDSFKEPLSIEL